MMDGPALSHGSKRGNAEAQRTRRKGAGFRPLFFISAPSAPLRFPFLVSRGILALAPKTTGSYPPSPSVRFAASGTAIRQAADCAGLKRRARNSPRTGVNRNQTEVRSEGSSPPEAGRKQTTGRAGGQRTKRNSPPHRSGDPPGCDSVSSPFLGRKRLLSIKSLRPPPEIIHNSPGAPRKRRAAEASNPIDTSQSALVLRCGSAYAHRLSGVGDSSDRLSIDSADSRS
jgi:hypothetical protein